MPLTDSARKQQAAAEIWLHYFNDCLFQQGLITERERNRMTVKIAAAHPAGQESQPGRAEKQQMV